MKPRRATLTSPAPCGAFLFPSATPCNRPAQAPPRAIKAGLPSALPLSPFRPVRPTWSKLGRFSAPSALAVRRPPLAIHVRTLPRPCRFPCPVPPFAVPGLPLPLPLPSAPPGKARQPLAAGLPPATCRPGRAATAAADLAPRRPADCRRLKVGFTQHR